MILRELVEMTGDKDFDSKLGSIVHGKSVLPDDEVKDSLGSKEDINAHALSYINNTKNNFAEVRSWLKATLPDLNLKYNKGEGFYSSGDYDNSNALFVFLKAPYKDTDLAWIIDKFEYTRQRGYGKERLGYFRFKKKSEYFDTVEEAKAALEKVYKVI